MSNRLYIVVIWALAALCCCNNRPNRGQLESEEAQEQVEDSGTDYDCAGEKLTLNIDDMIVVNDSDSDGKAENLSSNKNKTFTIVVYIGDDQCTACRLKAFHIWDDFIELMNSDNINYYFIVKPKEDYDIRVLRCAIDQTYFSRPVYLDVKGNFLTDNDYLVPVISPFSCLADEDGTVLYVGDPFYGYDEMNSIVNSRCGAKNGK